ncbi:ABC transporter permease [Thermodesulfobacteriota bacterium]
MQTIDISYLSLLAIYALLVVPLLLCWLLRLDLIKTTCIAVVRMSVQLGLVAVYLEVIFRLNNPGLNCAWILAMILIANVNIIRSAGLRARRFFFPLLAGVSAGTLLVVVFFVCIAVQPQPFYDARYLIPITGMVLGNCLRANVISLERFYAAIRKREKEFLTYLLMGATLHEAVRPYAREAIRPALAPTISTMATLGLVSLPGMMTGQILGGSLPMVAIKYQIAIMIAIFCATVITATVNIGLSLRVAFNEYEVLDKQIFADGTL